MEAPEGTPARNRRLRFRLAALHWKRRLLGRHTLVFWPALGLLGLVAVVGLDALLGTLVVDRLPLPQRAYERSQELGLVPKAGYRHEAVFAEHPDGGFHFSFNEQRLRGTRTFAVPKPDSLRRVLILGDSQTEGLVDDSETYPAQLDQLWPGTEVLNGGVGRYSPYQAYLRLESSLLRFEPDVVVVAIYCGNDPLDLLRSDDRPRLRRSASGEFAAMAPWPVVFADPPIAWWTSRSALYRLYRWGVKYRFDRLRVTHRLVSSFGGHTWDTVRLLRGFGRCQHRGLISQSLAQTAYFDRWPEVETQALDVLDEVVRRHRSLADREGYELYVLLLPSRLQVEAQQDQTTIEAGVLAVNLPLEARFADERRFEEIYLRLHDQGVALIDPRGALRSASSPESPVYWDSDYHLNVRGCRAVAEVLRDALDPAQP